MCGACHDIVLPSPPAPAAVHLERTYAEWQASVFARHDSGGLLTCGGCHMPVSRGKAATVQGALERSLHDHKMPGVDVALTPFPGTGDPEFDQRVQQTQFDEVQRLLDTTLRVEICVETLVNPLSRIRVTLENLAAGHSWPSGATQDRRAWVEVRAYAPGSDEPEYTSGISPENVPISALSDPDLWLMHDRATNAEGEPAHMFWDVAQVQTEGAALPVRVTNDPSDPDYYLTHVVRYFPKQQDESLPFRPERVTVQVRLRPIGLEVLDDLIDSDDLDPGVRDAMPVFDLLPNRHLADDPELSALATNTFEWSPATRESEAFETVVDTVARAECIRMPATRR
jgi:hypothetical protein